MSAFFDYLTNITYYLLFATLIGMAAPSGKYKKYVSLITGLVLVLLIVKPLQSAAGQGVPVTEWFSGVASVPEESAATEISEYEQWSYEQIGQAFEDQLYAQVEALLSREGYSLQSAEFDYTEDFGELLSMDLTVTAEPDAGKKSKPLIRIDPVKVGGNVLPQQEEENTDSSRIKKIILDFYSPNTPHINVKTVSA